jgi:hypothetical protein
MKAYLQKKYSEIKFSKEQGELIKQNTSMNKSFEKKNKYYIKNNFLYAIFGIISISFNVYLYIRLKNALLYIQIFKELKNEKDVQLFLNNKTDYYFQKRKQFLDGKNITYDESNLYTFQQKLSYLAIHESPEYKTNLVDKIKIHEYSKKVLGKDICSPILKVYDDSNEINLNELPDKFVLKCNHGSGMNIFCKDKKTFDLEKAKKIINIWKDTNYGLEHSEFQYLFVKRRILAAPYLGDNIIDYTCIIRVPQGSLSAYTSAENYPDPSEYIYKEY